MKPLISFYSNIFDGALSKNGDSILLAVSGGADSVSMLHLFWMLSKKIEIKLIVLNLNHNLRKESLYEAQIVKILSQKFNIPCILESIEPAKYAKRHSLSLETAGRILRYESFEKTALKFKCNKIATAHNANDNAETVLMRLLRGSGDFDGIPQRRKINKNLEIIRPLLNIKRKEIEKYVKEQKLPFCIDKTNFSDDFLRNKIRKYIIPSLEKLNPNFIGHIFNLTVVQSRQNAYLDGICAKLCAKSVKILPQKIIIDLSRFLEYNPAVRYRILKNLIPERKNSLQINILAKKISLSDKTPHILSKNWIFKLKGAKAVFEKV